MDTTHKHMKIFSEKKKNKTKSKSRDKKSRSKQQSGPYKKGRVGSLHFTSLRLSLYLSHLPLRNTIHTHTLKKKHPIKTHNSLVITQTTFFTSISYTRSHSPQCTPTNLTMEPPISSDDDVSDKQSDRCGSYSLSADVSESESCSSFSCRRLDGAGSSSMTSSPQLPRQQQSSFCFAKTVMMPVIGGKDVVVWDDDDDGDDTCRKQPDTDLSGELFFIFFFFRGKI